MAMQHLYKIQKKRNDCNRDWEDLPSKPAPLDITIRNMHYYMNLYRNCTFQEVRVK